MGHALWHYPVSGCDAVSATANANGFTPLTAIDRELGWNRDVVVNAANACNSKQEVCVVSLSPVLFLVPATKGKGDALFLISDLVAATRVVNVKALHMTHFGFIQGNIPMPEIFTVLQYLLNNSCTLGLNRIVFDIDSRIQSSFYKLLAAGFSIPPSNKF